MLLALKALLGLAAGVAAGYGYHRLMRCVGSTCINRKYPAVPMTLGAIAGLILAVRFL